MIKFQMNLRHVNKNYELINMYLLRIGIKMEQFDRGMSFPLKKIHSISYILYTRICGLTKR